MRNVKRLLLVLIVFAKAFCFQALAQTISINSPDQHISVNVNNGDQLTYSVRYREKLMIDNSVLGFEFQGEPAINGNFILTEQRRETFNETWKPVVKSKHAQILNQYNEIQLSLKEKSGLMRKMEFFVRVYDDEIGRAHV